MKTFSGLANSLSSCLNPQQLTKTAIFCRRKESVVTIYQYLKKVAKFHSYVGMFHASLKEETKRAVYDHFISPSSPLRCLLVTIAFGMVSTVS
jgi:superfamily II DNA helicase RecQ